MRSNVHSCELRGCTKDGGRCKGRFPQAIIPESVVDPDNGHIILKHVEPQLNTFTPLFTFLIRCNSDVTSLLSGTALKAVVAYVADYITKTPLKTHTVFDTVKSIFDRNSNMLAEDISKQEGEGQKDSHTDSECSFSQDGNRGPNGLCIFAGTWRSLHQSQIQEVLLETLCG